MAYSHHRAALFSTAAVVALALGGPALAQTAAPPARAATQAKAPSQQQEAEASATSLEEVVVTARRREERLMDVPVTATTFDEQKLQRYATQNMAELASQVPTLSISKSGGAGAGGSLSLRGIVGSASDAGIEQTVAVNIDGVQTSRGRIVSAGLLDLASTEVLLGPQSLFFGKNSPGGVVSFTSVSPGNQFEGYVRGGYAFTANRGTIEGAVSIPVTQTFSVRVAARYENSDGYTYNSARDKPGFLKGETNFIVPATDHHPAGYNDTTARVTLHWRPTDDLDVNFKVLGSFRRDNSATGNTVVISCAAGHTAPFTAGKPDPFGDCVPNYQVSAAGIPPQVAATMPFANADGKPFNDVDQYLSSLNVNYDMGQIRITSVTGLYYYRSRQFDGFDNTSLSQFDGSARDMNRTFSQEVRAASSFTGPLNFTAGLFYSHDSRAFSQVVKLINGGPDAQQRYYDAQSKDFNSNNTYSAFAQGIWNISPELEFTAGARYTSEHKTGSVRNVYVNPNVAAFGLYLPANVVVGGRVKAHNLSPEATLTWKPTPNLRFYAAYKTGYLSPGFSNPGNLNSKTSFETITFGKETAKGGEVGAKGQLFDGRLAGDLSIYTYTFKGLQATSFDVLTDQYVTKNVGEARTQGAQLQLVGRATEDLTGRLSIAYTDAHYVVFRNANCYVGQTAAQGCTPEGQDLSGRQFPGVPKWTVNYGATWVHPITATLNGELSADAYYRSSYNYHAGLKPGYVQDAYTFVNLAARIYPQKGPWEAAFIVKNVGGKFYILGGNDKVAGAVGDTVGALGDPREYEVRLTYRY